LTQTAFIEYRDNIFISKGKICQYKLSLISGVFFAGLPLNFVVSKRGKKMSDWDFLYEMNESGYSPEEIADAAGSGAARGNGNTLQSKK